MFSKSFLSFAILGLSALPGLAQTTGVGLWSFFGGPAFTDENSVGLVGADPDTNPGEGDMIQLGYFDGYDVNADPSNAAEFGAAGWASWTPIMGPGSINPHIVAQVGPIAGPIGYFTLGITLDPDAGDIIPANYDTYRLGVRFYNGNSLASSTRYSTVTGTENHWFLPTVATPANPSPTLNFENPAVLVFEGAAYMTDISLAPEPTTGLLVLLAGSLLLQRRHRR